MSGSRLRPLAGGLLLTGLLAFTALGAEGNSQIGVRPPPDDRLIYPPRMMRVSLDVLVDGQAVPTIHHMGRLYLPVPRMGAEYAIRINNHGPRRVAAVLSVDGLSTLNGQPATETHPGYVVAPYGNVVIRGWQRDQHTVAAFTFAPREKSYAYLMGHPENVGVIGLVAFEELTPSPRPYVEKSDGSPLSAKHRLAESGHPAAVGGMGTGWGKDVASGIYYIPFVRGTNRRTVTVYYDTPEALRRIGVPVDPVYPIYPTPFPGDPKYAPPPRPLV